MTALLFATFLLSGGILGFAAGVAKLGALHHAGWLHGLKLAAVAVVAQAVWGMGKKLCTDRARLTITLVSAAVLLARPSAVTTVSTARSDHALDRWFELSPIGMLVYDDSGLVVRSNAAFEALVGRSPVLRDLYGDGSTPTSTPIAAATSEMPMRVSGAADSSTSSMRKRAAPAAVPPAVVIAWVGIEV